MRWAPRNWRDILALVVVLGVPILWATGHLDEQAQGATIVSLTLVLQFYFRKSGGGDNG